MKTDFINKLRFTERERRYAELMEQFNDQQLNFDRLDQLDLPEDFDFRYFDSSRNLMIHAAIYCLGELNE